MPELNKKEMAALINMVWESLQAPTWTKDDLIAFGKAIFSKESLKSMDKKDFEKIFPFLSEIAKSFASKIDSVPASSQEKKVTADRGQGEEQGKVGVEDKAPVPTVPAKAPAKVFTRPQPTEPAKVPAAEPTRPATSTPPAAESTKPANTDAEK